MKYRLFFSDTTVNDQVLLTLLKLKPITSINYGHFTLQDVIAQTNLKEQTAKSHIS